MNAGLVKPPFDVELVGHEVAHGAQLGFIRAVRRSVENGRRYATVELDQGAGISEIPLEELTIITQKTK